MKKAKSKTYRIFRYVFLTIAAAYLLLTVEDLFTRDIDPAALEAKVLSNL